MFKLDEYDKYYAELQKGYEIQEVEPIDGERMFEVVKTAEPTPEEQAQFEIAELKQFLADTDYISNKLIEAVDDAELSDLKEKYADVLRQRREARARINELDKGGD